MSSSTPFTGGNALETGFGTADGGAAGDHTTKIPNNFSKIVSEVRGIHTRVCNVEAAAGSSGTAALRFYAEANGFFAVRRKAPRFFTNLPAIGAGTPVVVTAQPTTPNNLFTAPYAGARVDPSGAGSGYVQSICPGWMQSVASFSGQGSGFGGDVTTRTGMRLTVDLTSSHPSAADGNLNTGVGYDPLVQANTELPAFYQVLHRHMPIENMRGRSLSLRIAFQHAAAFPDGLQVVPYISYVDGGLRFDWTGAQAVTQTTGSSLLFLNSADTGMTDGVIPATATGVEVGLLITSPATTLAGTTDIDLESFTVDVGGSRGEVTPLPYGADWASVATFYAQEIAGVRTGSAYPAQFGNSTPFKVYVEGAASLGIVNPTSAFWTGSLLNPASADPFIVDAYPCSLVAPWSRLQTNAAASLVDGCRVNELIVGASTETTASTHDVLSSEFTQLAASFPNDPSTADFGDQVGLATALSLQFTTQVLAVTSQILGAEKHLLLDTNVEVSASISPLLA